MIVLTVNAGSSSMRLTAMQLSAVGLRRVASGHHEEPVDLMTLQPREEHPHGLADAEFDALFTTGRPVLFAYHGYPWLIHRLTYRRRNHPNLHVRGYREEGTTTTPFDMAVRNQLDRFHLVLDAIHRVPGLGSRAAHVAQHMRDRLIGHRQYILEHGDDPPELKDWKWLH